MNLKRIIAFLLSVFLVCSLMPVFGQAATIKFVSDDSGDAIKAIQVILKDAGIYKGAIDGKYGSGTTAAVKEYQKKNNLTQDGKCGEKTLKKMGLMSDAKVIDQAITTAGVRIRKGPSTSHPEYYVMAKGTALSILEEVGNWYKVRTGDGIEGYAISDYVKKEGTNDSDIYEGIIHNVKNYVNVRKGPDSDSASIGKLTNGAAVFVFEVKGDWVSIKTQAGLEGYVFSKYVNITQNSVEVPDVEVKIPDYTLKRGMNNNADVKQMQERLKELGFFSGTCTGNYASVTYSAVMAFQKANSLKADGIAGKQTLTKLYSKDVENDNEDKGNGDDELLFEIPAKALKKGMENNDVKIMQQRLKDLKYFEGTCTGYFGTQTLEAVKNFQKKNKLTVDGIAGVKTLSIMYSSSAIDGGLTEDEKLMLRIDAMIEHAKGYLGAKYVRGANGPNSFDCSGLTTTVFKEAMGYTMTRTAYTQGYNNFGRVIKSMKDLKKGDLVFFDTNANDSDLCDHVGIYIGDNQFIHASSSEKQVIISDITKRWWAEIFSWGKRVFE